MFDLLASEGIDATPLSRRQADACRLGPATPAGVDPYWLDLLKPVLSLSESLPYEIAHHLGSTRR
ncbi:hypothetical protein [Streptomyces canus]|uniref:hypothetical protein n=1 Tax=Streptomyces canus TaxID=58343 RepID=UPI0027D81CDA|nr:hypothetical protein [Streptomyces canus]